MRVNVYAEEITASVEAVEKEGHFGIRFYLELPVTVRTANGTLAQMAGPFQHKPGDDDSAAVTFWGRHKLHKALTAAIRLLEANGVDGTGK